METFGRTVVVTFAFTCAALVADAAVRPCMGLKGEGARAGGARALETVEAACELRLCVDGDATDLLRPTTLALLLTFALSLGAGVGEGEVGRDFKGEGGRERSWSNLGVTFALIWPFMVHDTRKEMGVVDKAGCNPVAYDR